MADFNVKKYVSDSHITGHFFLLKTVNIFFDNIIQVLSTVLKIPTSICASLQNYA